MSNTRPGGEKVPSFSNVPMTGVIYVMAEAKKKGYHFDDSEWVNFGQGQPEVGPLPGAPNRISTFQVDDHKHEYSPVAGIPALRQKVADFYNREFRRGKNSQYGMENVCIVPGGRAGLTRIAAALGPINLGHFLPDYTAYQELLGLFRGFIPIPILLKKEMQYEFTIEQLEEEITGRGLGGLLFSNPCNPTGKLISGQQMNEWVNVGRRLDCALIIDEFYSHYVYDTSNENNMVSAASEVVDVDTDPVAIIDGLTKNWRYPGWRVAWVVGPKELIKSVASTGSFLDGGASHPMQVATLPLLDPQHYHAENTAIHNTFSKKREFLMRSLKSLNLKPQAAPDATFYCWLDISGLPVHLRDGFDFFQACLDEKVIVVPGEFFDVDPCGRRAWRSSRFKNHVRLSFGPSLEKIELGMEKLRKILRS